MSRQVKIFVSAHKPCYEVENGVFVPARQEEARALLRGAGFALPGGRDGAR